MPLALPSRKFLLLAAAAVAVLLLPFLVWKVVHTPEWVVLTGSVEERQTVCRSVYRKSPGRAAWCLKRLLNDAAPAVRLPALEALARRPDLADRFRRTVEALANGGDPYVRARAVEYLFQRDGSLEPHLVDQAYEDLQRARFRDQHPELLALYLTCELERGNRRPVGWVLDLLEANPDEDCRPFRTVLRYPDLLRPLRNRFIEVLEDARSPGRELLLAALTAIDGQMRGTRAEDWRIATDEGRPWQEAAQGVDRFTVEAEWAHRVIPNFMIDRQQGELCLYLGEGAGGDHFWRRHEYSTVDIGKAYYTFTLNREDRYQIWIRCWFSDKCGNHSLLHIDDRWLQWRRAGYEDQHDPLQVWHWKRLETNVPLSAGQHTLVLTAGDDGLNYDRLAILPAEEAFDPDSPPPLNGLFDPAVPTAISLSADTQSQCRGTTQTVTVWVRRNSTRITDGTVALSVGPPFEILGAAEQPVSFTPGYPIAEAAFQVAVPEDAVGGEVDAAASFRSGEREIAAGSMILGLTCDWYTTGPLDPNDPRCRDLRNKQRLEPADLAEGWTRYPREGYDRLRRLNVEYAYGQHHDAFIFLYTEIEVTEAGSFESFLTLDDSGFVFIDGERICGRTEEGVGEGWMLVDEVRLTPGRHQVFAWIYQADFPEPEGADAGRHTPNHWVFKWLLRESRHRPAAAIRSVPVTLPE